MTTLPEGVQVSPPRVQTAEDAQVAYLRGEITEKEYKEIFGRFGLRPDETALVPPNANPSLRFDLAFENRLPEPPGVRKSTLEVTKAMVDTKADLREAAVRKDSNARDAEKKRQEFEKIQTQGANKVEKAMEAAAKKDD